MLEMAEKSYEAIVDAIDILKDFADYTPVKFLSYVFYPSTVSATISGVLSILFILV